MIGNDIIDLSAAIVNSRWQEQRFLDKLFSNEEQAFIMADENRFQNIWRLWSMKESAYKIYARTQKSPIFNPKSFKSKIHSEITGTVSFKGHILNTTTFYDLGVIYTTANIQNKIQFNHYLRLEANSQVEKTLHLREKAIQAFADLKSISKKVISIEKSPNGVPYFLINDVLQNDALTLTHHGNYGGFAIYF